MLGKGVEEGVGGAVCSLTAITYCSCGRREGDKEVKLLVGESVVEVPRAVKFRLDDRRVLLVGHLFEENVL